jgi:hypothetical protein
MLMLNCFWILKQGGDKVYFPNAAFLSVIPKRFTDSRFSVSDRGNDTGGNLATGGEVARWSSAEASLTLTTDEVGDLYEMGAAGGVGPYFVSIVRDLGLSGWTDQTPLWLILGDATQTAPNLWAVSFRLESQ